MSAQECAAHGDHTVVVRVHARRQSRIRGLPTAGRGNELRSDFFRDPESGMVGGLH